MTSISYLARAAYEDGTTPLDYAERQITTLLQEVHSAVTAQTAKGAAKCIVGEVMAAGWTPPPQLAPWQAAPRDIDPIASIAYQAGIAPIGFAEEMVAVLVDVCVMIDAAGGAPPEAAPEVPVGAGAFARRILGALLNAGWEMPVWPIPEPEQEAA